MAKKTSTRKGRKQTPATRRSGAGLKAAARRGAGARRATKAGRTTGKKKTARPKAKVARAKPAKRTTRTRAAKPKVRAQQRRAAAPKAPAKPRAAKVAAPRTSAVRQNDLGTTRRAPGLDRSRRQLREVDENVPTPPSSLDPDRLGASAARTGRQELKEALEEHTQTSPVLTGGDVDADWEDAYAVGDEAPGGDNPTPDQDRVDDIGKALGVEYQDNEELRASDKITDRDKHRWELDPASSEDYPDRD
jgi:uncharacterized protein DUF6335